MSIFAVNANDHRRRASLTLPIPHSSQELWPGSSANLPGAQRAQSADVEPPVDESKLPAGQLEHSSRPSPSVYLPSGQESQDCVSALRKVPGVQMAHVPLECEERGVGPVMVPD